MVHHASGSGVVRDRFLSDDPEEIERLVSTRFADFVALQVHGGIDVECGYETIATGAFTLGHTWTTVATTWDVGQVQDAVIVQLVRGGAMTHAGPVFGEIRSGAGSSVVVPPVGEFRHTAEAFDIDLVALDTSQVARFAEYTHGIAEADLRFTGLSPLTTTRQRRWDAMVARVRDEVLGNPVLADSAIVLDRAFRSLATSFLATFPSTAFNEVTQRRARRRIPESALREVREFLRAHAGEPVGPKEVSAVGGAPAADVAEAMCRRHDAHPAQALWDARLLGARRTLRDADPTTVDVASIAARWGFTRPTGFRLAYGREFGELPDETLYG